jgi:hypothetical protein
MTKKEIRAQNRRLDRSIERISAAVNAAKAKTIQRINTQLARMSPNDVAALERLIGKR